MDVPNCPPLGFKKEPLKDELLLQLIKTATEIYDREWQRENLWTIKVPIRSALIAGIANIILQLVR